jgi:flagellar hook-length control protein FliK
MSLLQLLAKSLEADDSSAPATDSDETTTKSTDDTTANDNANALALAQFTQALAAALGASTWAVQGAANTAPTPGSADASVSTRFSSMGSSMQDLVSALTQNLAADAKGKSDGDAPQFNVAATKDSSNDPGAANTAAAGPNSLAQLGVASHFALQHTQNDTNTGELKSPVGSSAWNDELGGQLTWMTEKGLESGSLRVSPEHLGPVEVQITVQNGDASVWFGASHPDTRAALEQALPQLRAMFANQGMTLNDAGVSRESPRNQGKFPSRPGVSAVSAAGSADVSISSAARMNLGLVDTYA